MPSRKAKSIIIRRACDADAPNIRALQDAALRISARDDYGAGAVESFLAYVGTLPPAPLSLSGWFVAVNNDEIVASGGWTSGQPAYAAFVRGGARKTADAAHIAGIYVDPAYTEAGLAKRILQAIVDDIGASGAERAHFLAASTGVPFLLSSGFETSGEIGLAFPDGSTLRAVSMTKAINPGIARAA